MIDLSTNFSTVDQLPPNYRYVLKPPGLLIKDTERSLIQLPLDVSVPKPPRHSDFRSVFVTSPPEDGLELSESRPEEENFEAKI